MKKRILSIFITLAMLVSLVTAMPVTASATTHSTPAGFSDNDYQKLVTFALQGDNLEKLGWNLSSPADWKGITWNDETPSRVKLIDFNSMNLTGNLDCSGFTSLLEANLRVNSISSINLSGCAKLDFLNCFDNNLTSLDVSDSPLIEFLIFSQNNIPSVDLSNNNGVTWLMAYDTGLENLKLSPTAAIETAYLYDNNLTDISMFEDLQKLEDLDVSNNLLDLNSSAVQSSITKIQSIINANGGTFQYTPQRSETLCPDCGKEPCDCPPEPCLDCGEFPCDCPLASIPISNREELLAIDDNLSGDYHLTADIDLAGSQWTPLGTFTGTLDGRGHVIRNLTITSTGFGWNYGLFTRIDDAEIINLGFVGTNINVSARMNMFTPPGGTVSRSDMRAGAIAGIANDSIIMNCYNTGNIAASASMGGTTISTAYSGGLVGQANRSFITSCYNSGNINAIARASSRTLSWPQIGIQNPNFASARAGGIVGSSSSVIFNCYNRGNISTHSSTDVPIGSNGYESLAGGIVGFSSGPILNVYNTGTFSAASSSTSSPNVMGRGIAILADEEVSVTNAFNNPTAATVFTGFDMTVVWGIVSGHNNGLPVLRGIHPGPFVGENPPATYAVTVSSAGTGATGGGNFVQGATVNITAGTPPAGMQFSRWSSTSAGVTFANANSASTSFVMPANAVTVTANFVPIPVVTGVTVSPNGIEVQIGTTQQFTAIVQGTNNPAQAVTWRVEGNSHAGTAINNSGLLTVHADEATGSSLRVIATSAANTAISGHAEIIITEEEPNNIMLISITSPSAITRPHGTAKTAEALNLPAQVTIVTSDGDRQAHVTWVLNDDTPYNPALTNRQDFTVHGAISLPEGVIADNIPFTVSVSVTVSARTNNTSNSSGGGGGGGGGSGGSTNTATTPSATVTTGTSTWTVTNIPRTALTSLALSAEIPVNQVRIPTGATGSTTVSVGADFAGQNAVLVKFNAETEQLEFVSAATIGANGNASMNITQTGDFLVLTFKTGDITGTGKVETADALALLRHVAGIAPLNPIQLFIANGKADDNSTADAMQILRYVAGVINRI
ncbi:MAG: Ig-like domain-containing protein [Oscillospiraceae bacterium]|jgi:hypothetical protein|nr:Ig-like domain-containing protein [Oscillospiraceae bacterium]